MTLRNNPYDGRIRNSVFVMLLCIGCSEQSSGVVGQEPIEPPGLNVRDFGAVGDGRTDDTFAFDAAIRALPASGGRIHVPEGIYMLRAVSTNPNRVLDLTA